MAWAILAAFGTAFFASGILNPGVSHLLTLTRQFELPANFEIVGMVVTALAAAVAWRAGGWIALVGYVAIVIVERLFAIPGQVLFCERSAGAPAATALCSLAGELERLWPQAIGLALAIPLARWLRASGATRNGILEAAGALSVAQILWSGLLNIVAAPAASSTRPADETTFAAVGVSAALVTGALAGAILARRAARSWLGYWLIAGIVLLSLVAFTIPNFVNALSSIGLEYFGVVGFLAFSSPLVMLASCAAALGIVRARMTNGPDSTAG